MFCDLEWHINRKQVLHFSFPDAPDEKENGKVEFYDIDLVCEYTFTVLVERNHEKVGNVIFFHRPKMYR